TILILAKMGFAEVFLMTGADRDIAFILNLRAGNLCYCSVIAFEESLSHFSVGKVLMNICVETLLNQSITSYDFLFGDGEYKQFWSNRTRMVFRSTFYRGFRSWLASWIPYRLHGKLAEFDTFRELLTKIRKFRKWVLTAKRNRRNT
ncbi:MAG: GNAT family N-acetyltransferase, partial [Syntrophales bacterium LBB04]|nr:GNAT family N-acetyltransferase [Syntrophales bacterium LBB04]